MKVKLGKYPKWWGPYQIADLLLGNPPTMIDPSDETWRHRWSYALGSWLASISWFSELCEWIHKRRKRMVYVKIDYWDTWNMDDTLRHIIGPMLVQLQATKMGSGFVDDEDVPAHLRSTACAKPANEWDTDDNFHQRYEWMLSELVWVFTADHEAAEGEFFTIKPREPGTKPNLFNDYTINEAGLREYQARVQNAYRLFGKYYQTLWD
jgi:hypothetical protein